MLEWVLRRFRRVRLFAAQQTIARQAPLSVGLSRQEYRSGLPFPSPGHLPDQGIEPGSSVLQAGSWPLSHWGRLTVGRYLHIIMGMYQTATIIYSIQKNLARGNTEDTSLTEVSLFIWNLNFTGDPLFHLATLLGAPYFTIKSSLMGGQSAVTSVSQEVLKTSETCIHWKNTTKSKLIPKTQATLK